MKKAVLFALLACLFLLPGCPRSADSSDGNCPPDSSRALYFSETHRLHPEHGDILCAVTVDRVLEHRYSTTGYDSLVLQATAEEIFGGSRTFFQGDSILVWVGINDLRPFTNMSQEEVDQAAAELRRILEEADSLILYGSVIDPILLQSSPEYELWLEDTEGTFYSSVHWDQGEYRLDLAPSIRITGLQGWEILPIQGGVLDGSSLNDLIASLGSEMAFDLDHELPQGRQYFKNGDSAGDVYQAMGKYAGN